MLLVCVSGQLWVSVGGGKVMVYDASSWSLIQTCQVGNARLVRETGSMLVIETSGDFPVDSFFSFYRKAS